MSKLILVVLVLAWPVAGLAWVLGALPGWVAVVAVLAAPGWVAGSIALEWARGR